MSEQHLGNKAPKAFISYSWNDDAHKEWVKSLATRLRADGVDVTLDQWSMVPGDRLPVFMETAIRNNSYVLIVCTPKYKHKSDNRTGGAGYEGDIMTGEVFSHGNHRKFIPILREGDRMTAIPTWLNGKYDIDLRGSPYSEQSYSDLLISLHSLREQAPPVGPVPDHLLRSPTPTQNASGTGTTLQKSLDFEPIKILGVIADEVTEPRNDGTQGSALYSVPFKLSRTAPREWAELFVQTWNHPPQWTSRHRPGTAEVRGDRVTLTRTTIEEVQEVHRETLKLVVEKVNQEYAQMFQRQRTAEQAKESQRMQHKESVRRGAENVKFD
jgi:hypothetical protein